ncbi:hypothetical protein P171DRAFT_430761 [Karstenula rhodostoma CBS 690.94]|uniref:Wax synthase domain-containing protein n=1 Tax=Karstenula rhodostoma CBS 690.94 TaxID=1392251 RepID=A0A9P4PKB5_9PLEO|nr:hypothetical protein P171DRAFT_430761 [Karstenula rhodostoma CBS 690.94]
MRPLGMAKLRWAAAQLVNPRLVRWNLEAKNVPRPTVSSKATFLCAQTAALLKMVLATDLLLQLGIRLFWTPPAARPGARFAVSDSKYLSIRDPDLGWGFAKTLVFACGPYFFMSMQYVAVSLIAVALQLSQPIDFPPLFGNVADATTVRAFWGQFWHQSIRRSVTTLAYLAIDALHIARGTTLASYAHVWLAFFISGFMHAQSMALLPRPPNITLHEATAGMLYFFLWQAFAITAEDFVIWLWKTSGLSINPAPWNSVLGYVWVIFSMWISIPWAADVMMRLRLTEESFLGFTVFGRWINHQ